MKEIQVEEERIKELFKKAVLEVFQEQRELIYEVFSEILEDVALSKAIQEGASSEPASREEVMKNLTGAE